MPFKAFRFRYEISCVPFGKPARQRRCPEAEGAARPIDPAGDLKHTKSPPGPAEYRGFLTFWAILVRVRIHVGDP